MSSPAQLTAGESHRAGVRSGPLSKTSAVAPAVGHHHEGAQQQREQGADAELGREESHPAGHGAPIGGERGVAVLLAEGQGAEQAGAEGRGR